MPPDPQGVTWDAPPQQVRAPGQRQGGVILTDPTVQSQERREDTRTGIAVQGEERQGAQNTWTTMTPEEVAAQGLPPGVYQRNGLGEIKTISDKPPTEAGAVIDVRTQLQNVIDKAREAQSQSHEGWFATGFGADAARQVGGTTAADVAANLQTIAGNVAFDRLQSMRQASPTGGALGAISERELSLLQSTIASLDQSQSDEQFQHSMQGVIDAYTTVLGKLPDAQPGDRGNPLDTRGTQQENTLTADAGAVLTAEDKALQDEIRGAYSAGASLEELQAISAKYNRRFPIATQEELDAARSQGRAINVDPSGYRNEPASVMGISPDSKVGAGLVMAANGLLSGGMDELGSVFGLDPQQIEAGKQMLRDKYPVASAVGETAGQVAQMVGATRALGAAGMGARAAGLTADVAGGAAYGAGESNDNRLVGGAIGGLTGLGGNVLAGRIASRLGTPEAQSAISRYAQENGLSEEEVTRVLSELGGESETAAAQPLTEATQQETAALARRAVGTGPGARAARRKLAELAKVNPEASGAAERLGVDLPVDILSDSAQVQSLAGLARSQAGSEAETAWRQTAARVSQQADDAIEALGGSTDIAQVSDDVRSRLNASMEGLESQAATLRRGVDEAINVRDPAPVENLRRVLGEEVADLGGETVARDALSTEEKKLLGLLRESSAPPTYARLNRLRDEIGDALFKGKGPWADTSQRNLSRYYGALADDQLAYIQSVGGDALAEQMRASNTLFSQMFDMRRDMQTLYGKQLEGSLGPLLNRALAGGKKGDAKALNQLLERVPQDMQGPALLSAIMAQSRTRAGGSGGFSFANFANLYRGLRDNGPIYGRVAQAVGPDGERVLTDLYAISRRMAEGENKVLKTGKANQVLANALTADSLVGGVMRATARRAVTGAAAGAGGLAAGPGGAFAGATLAESAQQALAGAGKNRLARAHELLSSSEFRGLAETLSTGGNTTTATNRLLSSKPFNRFASMVGLKTPEDRRAWLGHLLTAGSSGVAGRTLSPEPGSTIEITR